MDKATAMRFLSEAGAFSGPVEWPAGVSGLKISDPARRTSVFVSREEVERGRCIEYWSEMLKCPEVVVQIEPEAGQ